MNHHFLPGQCLEKWKYVAVWMTGDLFLDLLSLHLGLRRNTQQRYRNHRWYLWNREEEDARGNHLRDHQSSLLLLYFVERGLCIAPRV